MSRPRSKLDKAAALEDATAQRDRAIARMIEESETDPAIENEMRRLTAAVTSKHLKKEL